jgi:hypothetical protein
MLERLWKVKLNLQTSLMTEEPINPLYPDCSVLRTDKVD